MYEAFDPDATGSPTITGPPQVGKTLTAGMGDIADDDGLPTTFPNDYTFQWIRVGTDESETNIGSNQNTYTPVAADVTSTIKVVVSFTDDAFTDETVTSAETFAVMPAASSNCTDNGTVWCGTLTVGHTLDLNGFPLTVGFSSNSSQGSVTPLTFILGGVQYTVTQLISQGGLVDVYFTTTPTLPTDGARLSLHLQRVSGESDHPLSGNYDGVLADWVLGAAAYTTASDPKEDVSVLRNFARDNPLPADTDIGTEVAVRLSQQPPPEFSSATVDGTTLVITFDKTLAAAASLANSAFTVKKNASATTVSLTGTPSISGATVTLTLATAVTHEDTDVKVSYTKPSTDNNNRLEDAEGNETESFTDQPVTNNTAPPPEFSSATVDGATLVITFDKTLAAAASLANSAFTVKKNASATTVSLTGTPSISGATVTLTLATAVTDSDTDVKVSYTKPTSGSNNRLEDTEGNETESFTDEPVTNNTGNTPGTAQEGQTLTAAIGTIADAEGLPTTFPDDYRFQWVQVDGGNDNDIAGATLRTYTPVSADVGKKVKVKVSFTDGGNFSETRTSGAYPSSGTITRGNTSEPKTPTTRASSAPDPKLRAYFRDVPAEHDGSTAFTVLIAFSERISATAEQVQQALTVTGGTVTSVREVSGLGDRWEITVTPNSDDAVRISLPSTTSCSAAGAICSSNGSKMLERGLSVSIARAPLTAGFAEVPAGHHGTSFALHLAFSEPVATTAEALEQALTVTNATVRRVQPVDDRSDLWEITVTPSGNDEVSLSLPQTTSCDDDSAVCTATGRMLSEGTTVSITRAPLTAGFEQVPTGHIGIPFTLQLAFSEPVATTATTLKQALTVTGGTTNTIQPVGNRRDLWEIQIQPNAADVSLSLSKTTSCTAERAVCTQEGLALQNDAEADIPFSGYLMPHTLDKVSGEDQTGPANTQLAESFVVLAADEDGATLAGVIVTFTVSAGGGMLSANTDADPCTFESSQTSITAITDATGQAAARLTLGSEAGTNTVDISVGGLEPEPFTATATEPATPNALATVCGEDQQGTAGELLAEPLVVFVSDEDGAAMAGVAVSFAVTAGGGRCRPP